MIHNLIIGHYGLAEIDSIEEVSLDSFVESNWIGIATDLAPTYTHSVVFTGAAYAESDKSAIMHYCPRIKYRDNGVKRANNALVCDLERLNDSIPHDPTPEEFFGWVWAQLLHPLRHLFHYKMRHQDEVIITEADFASIYDVCPELRNHVELITQDYMRDCQGDRTWERDAALVSHLAFRVLNHYAHDPVQGYPLLLQALSLTQEEFRSTQEQWIVLMSADNASVM